jgi:hypothetical protein
MSSVRFTEVVKNCGKPESYVLLIDPAKDPELQKALKAQRVMTIFQAATGGKADHGEVGLMTGHGRQFLIFPKSLRAYAGRQVIAIKYDLWRTAEPEKKTRLAPAAKRPPDRKPKRPARASPPERAEPRKEKPEPPVVLPRPEPDTPRPEERPQEKPRPKHAATRPRKLVSFPATAKAKESDEVLRLKKQVRRAMAALEEGKEVAAFNLLQRIVE